MIPKETVLVGIIDGIPDIGAISLKNVDLQVEKHMVPKGYETPDVHGTEITSLILQQDKLPENVGASISGLALPIFFNEKRSESKCPVSQTDLARALTIAAERQVDIVNVSAGQKSETSEASRHLKNAIELCYERSVLIIAAAGNDGCECLHLPAADPTVLAVGAMDVQGRPFDCSNWGANYFVNGLLAPGVDIDVPGEKGRSVKRSGTSYATAIVSRVASRLLTIARRADYKIGALDIRSVLLDSVDRCDPEIDGSCARTLSGKLNIQAAEALLHQRGMASATTFSTTRTSPTSNKLETATMTGTQNLQNAAILEPYSYAANTESLDSSTAIDQQACSCEGEVESKNQATVSPRPSEDVDSDLISLTQQACGCSSGKPPQLIYALGSIWFDFGTEARYDAIVQQMNDPVAANTPSALFSFLQENLEFASGITFILMQDQIPIYAIAPSGPFALDVYRAMLDALSSSMDAAGEMQRVAIPGFVSGSTRLMNGMTLPVIYPDLRGMVKWQSQTLVENAKAAANFDDADDDRILNFLVRVYDELRNLGMSADERALNFAATNAFQIATAFSDALAKKLELFSIAVGKSPICRPDSDCWDVKLQMFDPENERRAGRVYRFTVDVSEVKPVTVGAMRSWSVPLTSM